MASPNFKSNVTSDENMIFSKPKLFTNYKNYEGFIKHLLREPTIRQTISLSRMSTSAATNPFPNTLNLPHLPVPKLEDTTEKYLKSVKPFLNNDELFTTTKVLDRFKSGVGRELQALLEQRALKHENWLSDWWLKVAYLQYRDPVVVYSNPGMVYPCECFQTEEDRLIYTAKFILAAMSYKSDIDNDKMPQEKMGKDLLDMNQYKKIFGTCRIPGFECDGLRYNRDSKHIVVVRNNNFFKLQILNCNNEMPSVNQLIVQLREILQESECVAEPIGVLSSDNRDNWFKYYLNLLEDETNKCSVTDIENSLFLIALDNPMPVYKDDDLFSMVSNQFIHGGGSRANSGNRWFDKTVQFIIGSDGVVGLCYEHSPSEGQPIAVMSDYLLNYIKSDRWKQLPDTKLENGPIKLRFNVNEKIAKDIQAANINVDKLAENLDCASFKFDCFGKEFIKSQKLSPDSFIQMAIQYAFYRIHKVPGAHYESAATRKYIHGRTETIRSCSVESIKFAKTMLDCNKNDANKVDALKNAINAHKKYSIEAVNGFGVDRHLLGLKLIALENGIALPELYKDVSYTRSTHMRLSTSQVATKGDAFMVFGPLTPDGYACCYNPRPDDINFGVTAFREHPDTCANRFRDALRQSLVDMHDVLAKTQKSKL